VLRRRAIGRVEREDRESFVVIRALRVSAHVADLEPQSPLIELGKERLAVALRRVRVSRAGADLEDEID